MKAKLIKNPIERSKLLLCLPKTGNASALLLEWASEYAHCPIVCVLENKDNDLVIDLGDNHSFYSEALRYINSNL